MIHRSKWLAAAAFIAYQASFGLPAQAGTPPDTLVAGWAIDDMISLDPAEAFELSTSEFIHNSYEKLVKYDLKDVSKVSGAVAESWTVSDDGKTISFKIRQGRKFASGNPITADDVVYSLTRAVKMDKSPAFILNQFGLTKDNVDQMVVKTGDYSVDFKMDQPYAPSFVLYCLTSTVGSILDKKLVQSHEKDGDFGYNWLKTNYAGSGPFTIREWKANDSVVMDRNKNYSGEAPKMKRLIFRHIPEASTERIMLEKGDLDMAMKLGPDEIAAVKGEKGIKVEAGQIGYLWYLGLNQKNPTLAKPEVREAMKYLVDYSAIADTLMKGSKTVHQAFLPHGFLGAVDDTPYSLNVAKAKELLAKAGVPDGFTVTMDVRNNPDTTAMAEAIQATMAQAGVKVEIIPGDGKQTLTKYRARQHDIYIGPWGPDYQDPNTNSSAFAENPDNADGASVKSLAWRNAWDIPELTKESKAAAMERDADKRAADYVELQKKVMAESPFVVMFQDNLQIAMSDKVDGFILGPSYNAYEDVTKK
ncbi:ABC transporter substrate-binding protein [Paenirhodobacter enshiensis]|uniref:ABC transporter substrate-binding protein n=1 Tax=Paenirhodobacter enshiensis TaxID=1105367 RepID=A0A086Y3U3_9RHOB|nr:ABC transporter substrate-binding protein [Paenirhodobacter enshiensis]KFI28943.1 ABC transporter substrate-binding protein [Paenirhodobacter enshiensis]